MSTTVLMPALSPTMTEGKLSKWLKKEGDTIQAGDILAEIETDKATMEMEAVDEGILGRILVPEGTDGVKINAPIAIIVEENEVIPDIPVPSQADNSKKNRTENASASTEVPTPSAVNIINGPPQPSPVIPSVFSPITRIFISPLARRIAELNKVDISQITGTGPHGRIVRKDIEEAVAKGAFSSSKSEVNSPVLSSGGYTAVPNSSMRRTIARRLVESKTAIPHFYVSVDVELDALITLRSQLNALSSQEHEGQQVQKLSINDMLIKAMAIAQKRTPQVNASYTDEAILFYDDIDISIAVSLENGLITPVLHKVDQKTLNQISQEAKSLITRARAGKLKPEEYQGGGITISNMGMYGVREFSAIINPPQAAILAVSAGEKRAVVKHNALTIATVMTVTLSVDHRVVDGALGARWLSEFKSVVESPLNMLI